MKLSVPGQLGTPDTVCLVRGPKEGLIYAKGALRPLYRNRYKAIPWSLGARIEIPTTETDSCIEGIAENRTIWKARDLLSEIRRDLRMSPTTVNQAIDRLDEAGWIVRTEKTVRHSPPVRLCRVTLKGKEILKKTRV